MYFQQNYMFTNTWRVHERKIRLGWASLLLYTRPVTSLGHLEGQRLFWGAQIFWTMSNNFKRCPMHFSRWVPPGYAPAVHHSHQPPNLCYRVEPLLFALVGAICCQCKLTFFYLECTTWPSPVNKTFVLFNGISRVQPIFPPTLPCFHLVAETRSVSSVFIAQGYQRSNVQNRHPFYHLPYRDDRIVDFHYPILTCFWKMISDPNPVLVEIILSVSESVLWCTTYILYCAYFDLLGKILAEHNWLK